MAHYKHEPTTAEEIDEHEARRNTRRGLILFCLYSTFYAGFVLTNAFWPQAMDTIVFAGVNLAIVYGLLLIAAAFVLALFYAWLCSPQSPADVEARE